jgi:hypothetical protein
VTSPPTLVCLVIFLVGADANNSHGYHFEIALFLSWPSISTMNKIITLLSIVVWMTLLSGCKKDKDKIKISGFQLTDAFGNQMTTIGYVNDDWKLNDWSTLTPFEKSLFDFADTISLSGTVVSAVQIFPSYPNPASSYSSLSFSVLSQPGKFLFLPFLLFPRYCENKNCIGRCEWPMFKNYFIKVQGRQSRKL